MGSRSRRILWLVAAAALTAGFSLSLLWNPEDPFTIRGRLGGGGARLGAAGGEEVELVLRYEWPDGRVGRVARQPLPEDLGGLSPAEVAARRPQWRLESVTPRQVVAALPCQEGSEGFLGVARGYVAIFDGSPDGCSRLRELTDIPLQELPSFQVADLRRGIPFQEETELRMILEGLRGP